MAALRNVDTGRPPSLGALGARKIAESSGGQRGGEKPSWRGEDAERGSEGRLVTLRNRAHYRFGTASLRSHQCLQQNWRIGSYEKGTPQWLDLIPLSARSSSCARGTAASRSRRAAPTFAASRLPVARRSSRSETSFPGAPTVRCSRRGRTGSMRAPTRGRERNTASLSPNRSETTRFTGS